MKPMADVSDIFLEEKMEGKGDNGEIILGEDEPISPSSSEDSSNCSSDGRSSYLEQKLDLLLEALRRQAFPAISDCMKIVVSFPGFEEGSRMYSEALLLLTKKNVREVFMCPTSHEVKMDFLKLLMEK
ncbi:hypothetical protein LXL04_023121 [Taraxacum kok-saghyz]